MTRDEAWFVSDVHLKDGQQAYLDRFLRFLDLAAERTRALWLMGDIFEFYVGDRVARTRFYAPLFERVRRMAEAGVEIRIIRGNRDQLIESSFADAGAEMMPPAVVAELGGRRVHVSHGDRFCAADRTGDVVRRIVSWRLVRRIARLLPAFVGRWVARGYRGVGGRKHRRQARDTGNRFHTIEAGVREELERGGHDVLVCGHVHWLNDGTIEIGGRPRRVITTGAWEDGPNYVVFDGRDFSIRLLEPAQPSS